MKKSLLILLALLTIGVSMPGHAQNKVTKPGAATTKPQKPAGNRPNSPTLPHKPATPPPTPEKKPEVVRQAPPPPPAPPKKPSSSGLGFKKGDNLLNIGVGLSSYYYGNPIGISFESGIDKDFSVGAQLDYNAGNYGNYYYNSSRWRYTATYLGVRGSYHFNRVLKLNTKKVDLYAGVGLGYRSFRWNDSSYGYGYDYRSGLFFNYFIGGKYYFNNNVGAFVELGYTGLSSSRVGLTIKF